MQYKEKLKERSSSFLSLVDFEKQSPFEVAQSNLKTHEWDHQGLTNP